MGDREWGIEPAEFEDVPPSEDTREYEMVPTCLRGEADEAFEGWVVDYYEKRRSPFGKRVADVPRNGMGY